MNKAEVISNNYQRIAAEMVERYRTVLESEGRVQYKVYIWEDGEIECLEAVAGDTTYLKPNDYEERKLYYVCMVAAPDFNPWDCVDHAAPEDDAEREAERAEIVDFMVQEYETNVGDVLDIIIEDAEKEG